LIHVTVEPASTWSTVGVKQSSSITAREPEPSEAGA
jgi:hypothetical protein